MSADVRRPHRLVITVIAFVVLLGAALSLSRALSRTPAEGGQLSAPTDRPAPALSGPTVGGGTADLARLHGQVVVVNIWASWCAPCRSELPVLARARDRYPRSQVAFLGIATRDRAEDARGMLSRTGLRMPSILDPDGSIAVDWGAAGVPETFVVDRDGRIRAHHSGAVSAAWLSSTLRPLENG